MREDPMMMPEATVQASGRWIAMAADYLRKLRASVLIETTLRSSKAMEKTIASFRESGYIVEIRAVTVAHEVSRLVTAERYLGQIATSRAGRWTLEAAHDEAFERAAGTVRGQIASGIVDRFVIEDRAGRVLFDDSYVGIRDEELQEEGRRAAAEFEQARSLDRLRPKEAIDWLEREAEQIERLRKQGPLKADQVRTIKRIAMVDVNTVAVRANAEDGARASEVLENIHAASRATVTVSDSF